MRLENLHLFESRPRIDKKAVCFAVLYNLTNLKEIEYIAEKKSAAVVKLYRYEAQALSKYVHLVLVDNGATESPHHKFFF